MILMRANPFRGTCARKIETFLGLEIATSEASRAIGPKKVKIILRKCIGMGVGGGRSGTKCIYFVPLKWWALTGVNIFSYSPVLGTETLTGKNMFFSICRYCRTLGRG